MNIAKYIWLTAGFIFLGIGLVGIVLPLLPTTPFLMLTLFCFTKGSSRVREWFMSSAIYRKHLKSFNETRAMPLKTKVIILATATCMLSFAFYFSPKHGRIAIVLVGLLKYYFFLFKIKTIPVEK